MKLKLVDGTTVSMPDTEANQAEYPQQAAQEEGVGFPVARIVVLFRAAIGRGNGWGLPVSVQRVFTHAQGLRLRGVEWRLAMGVAPHVAFPI